MSDRDNEMIVNALRDNLDATKEASKEMVDLKIVVKGVSVEQQNNKAEIERGRKHRETLERRITVIESQKQGGEKAGANVASYVGILVALGAAIVSLIGLFK